jgi:hypothetical protein
MRAKTMQYFLLSLNAEVAGQLMGMLAPDKVQTLPATLSGYFARGRTNFFSASLDNSANA